MSFRHSAVRRRGSMKQESRKIPFVVLVIFIVLFIIGININEVSAVWEKAVQICFNCIGIG